MLHLANPLTTPPTSAWFNGLFNGLEAALCPAHPPWPAGWCGAWCVIVVGAALVLLFAPAFLATEAPTDFTDFTNATDCEYYPPFSEGDKVEVRYRGRSRYYPGRIRRVHGDGTYDIDYDDGERERGVRAELIRSLGERVGTTRLSEGNRVEARYRGRSRYYPGRIQSANRDGTYDIDYDDGERDRGVRAELIRSLEVEEKVGLNLAALIAADPSARKDMVGERLYPLVAQFKPELAGKITGMLLESMVDGELISLLESSSSSSSPSSRLCIKVNEALMAHEAAFPGSARLKVGDKVFARQFSNSRAISYFPGQVERVNADGSYDVEPLLVRPDQATSRGVSRRDIRLSRYNGGDGEDGGGGGGGEVGRFEEVGEGALKPSGGTLGGRVLQALTRWCTPQEPRLVLLEVSISVAAWFGGWIVRMLVLTAPWAWREGRLVRWRAMGCVW